MELTGKCKEEFDEWYGETFLNYADLNAVFLRFCDLNFHYLPKSVRYGVLVDYFNSVDYKVYVAYNEVSHKWNWHIDFKPVRNDCNGYPEFELPEARTKAIEKANELRNQQLNK